MSNERNYSNECGDHGGKNREGEPCGRPAGWGTDFDDGKCKHHRGTNADGSSHEGNSNAEGNDGGAPEENTNATSHGAFTKKSKLYSQEFDALERDLADRIYDDYFNRYVAVHGREPTSGEDLRLTKISVNAVTEMRVENWFTDRPSSLETGTETPLIDRETHISESGQRYYRYKKSPAVGAIKHLESYNRQWLKTLGLLDDPDSAKADSIETLAEVLSE